MSTPTISKPFSAIEIHTLVLKDIISNKFKDGKLSRLEEVRRINLKESRRRKRKVDAENGADDASEVGTPPPGSPALSRTPLEDVGSGPGPSSQAKPVMQSGVPRVHLVNGMMQIDESSLIVQAPTEDPGSLQRVEEGTQRYVTSLSFRHKEKLRKVTWSNAMTDRFFEGLSYFGTNFSGIALMFPSMTRSHIKLKYSFEERANPQRVTQALRTKRTPDPDLKTRMMGMIPEKELLDAAIYHTQPKQEDDMAKSRERIAAAAAAAKVKPSDAPAAAAGDAPVDVDEDGGQAEAGPSGVQDSNRQQQLEQQQQRDQEADAAISSALMSQIEESVSRARPSGIAPNMRPRVGPNIRTRRPPRPGNAAAPAAATGTATETGPVGAGSAPAVDASSAGAGDGAGDAGAEAGPSNAEISAPSPSRRGRGMAIRTPAARRQTDGSA
ncbi:hypothetical protein BC831DRAFT_447556 [Entophlyctis helioformis]|nr:hypothetical protein BC831DRAFT_447556 [Entophlyctis helioformis]